MVVELFLFGGLQDSFNAERSIFTGAFVNVHVELLYNSTDVAIDSK